MCSLEALEYSQSDRTTHGKLTIRKLTSNPEVNRRKQILFDTNAEHWFIGVTYLHILVAGCCTHERVPLQGAHVALVHRTEHILDLNPFLVDLIGKLADLIEDPNAFMRGKVDLFGPEFASKSGFLKDRATEPSPNKEIVAVYLRYMFHKCLCCLERVKPKFLPGGRYANAADEKLRSQTASVPTTNRRNEATS
jgi:hypothetical protein